MACFKDLPPGRHEVKLGESFKTGSTAASSYHTVRYDFKPASVGESSESYIALGENNAVTVVVPKINGESEEVSDVTVFRGAKKKPKEKECLLLYDHASGEFRLEQLNSQIQVKKTARNDEKTKEILEAVRAKRKKQKGANKSVKESEDVDGGSSSNDSSSSTDSEDSDDDNEEHSEDEEDLRLSDSSDDED